MTQRNARVGTAQVALDFFRRDLAAVLRRTSFLTRHQMKKVMATDRTVRAAEDDSQTALPTHPVLQGDREPLIVDSTINLIQKRHLVSASEFQVLMGWTSPRSVSRALAARRIFAMAREEQQYFPGFFSDRTYNRRHLSAVSRALGELPGGAKFQFFVSRKGSLAGATPLEALVAGRLQRVLDLAAAYAET